MTVRELIKELLVCDMDSKVKISNPPVHYKTKSYLPIAKVECSFEGTDPFITCKYEQKDAQNA